MEDASAAKVSVEAVKPDYKAIVVTRVRAGGGLQLVSGRGGEEKGICDLLWRQNPQDRLVGCIWG